MHKPTPEALVMRNTKVKQYLNGYSKVTFCSKSIFKLPGYELIDDQPKEKETKEKNMNNPTRADSVKRAKEKVFDIAYLNEFDYFITWTLDQKEIDRYDPDEVSKKLKIWLNNMSKRKGLKYLVIPEYHKDGAIHMHGLISGDIDLVDSGKTDSKGHTIYNMPQWKYGYSTAIETYGDVGNTAKYITKYITKDLKKIFGSFYYAGGGVNRTPQIQLYNMIYQDVECTEHFVAAARIGFKYAQIKDGEFVGS